MESILQPVILRLAFYVLSPLIAMIPVSWTGLVAVSLDQATGHMIINADLQGIIAVGVAAGIASVGVFAKWGIKAVPKP